MLRIMWNKYIHWLSGNWNIYHAALLQPVSPQSLPLPKDSQRLWGIRRHHQYSITSRTWLANIQVMNRDQNSSGRTDTHVIVVSCRDWTALATSSLAILFQVSLVSSFKLPSSPTLSYSIRETLRLISVYWSFDSWLFL